MKPHWSTWGAWSSCSATCNGGKRARTRRCVQPSNQHGCPRGSITCLGQSRQESVCNSFCCPGKTVERILYRKRLGRIRKRSLGIVGRMVEMLCNQVRRIGHEATHASVRASSMRRKGPVLWTRLRRGRLQHHMLPR